MDRCDVCEGDGLQSWEGKEPEHICPDCEALPLWKRCRCDGCNDQANEYFGILRHELAVFYRLRSSLIRSFQ